MQIQSLSGRHFTMLQSKQRHMEICGRRRLVLLTEKSADNLLDLLIMGIDHGADPEMAWTWYEALFLIDNCLSWRSLLGGLNVMWFHYVSLFFRFQTWHDSPILTSMTHVLGFVVKPPDGQNRVATLVGPGHLRKDGKPRQHHLQQPRYSPVQGSLKLQLDMSRKMYLICPVSSNVEDSLKMFETCIWATPLSSQMWYSSRRLYILLHIYVLYATSSVMVIEVCMA